MLNFASLAQACAGHAPFLRGLFPPLSTVGTLLLVALGFMAASTLGTNASAVAALWLPTYLYTILGVAGFSFLNLWFARDIQTALLSTRTIGTADYVFKKLPFAPHVNEELNNDLNLHDLVRHMVAELNVFFNHCPEFKATYGEHQPLLQMPRLLVFRHIDPKLIAVNGPNSGKSALIFSSAMLEAPRRFTQRQLAALIAMELIKMHLRRGVSGKVTAIGADLITTFKSMGISNGFFRLITWPVQFFFLMQKALERAFCYEAAKWVVPLGRGMDLLSFLDENVCKVDKPTKEELRGLEAASIRMPPYEGSLRHLPFVGAKIGTLCDWIDKTCYYPGDDQTGYRLDDLFRYLVREGLFWINELWDEKPRSTNLNNFLRPRVTAEVDPKAAESKRRRPSDSTARPMRRTISMNDASKLQLQALKLADEKRNAQWRGFFTYPPLLPEVPRESYLPQMGPAVLGSSSRGSGRGSLRHSMAGTAHLTEAQAIRRRSSLGEDSRTTEPLVNGIRKTNAAASGPAVGTTSRGSGRAALRTSTGNAHPPALQADTQSASAPFSAERLGLRGSP